MTKPKAKIVYKYGNRPNQTADQDSFIIRHEKSLLSLLIEKHPDEARRFLERSERHRVKIIAK